MSSDRDAPLIDGPPGRTNAFHVDLDALDHNVDEIRRMVGPEVLIFAALKANAYGFGVVEIAHAVLKSGADGLAVVDLRDAVLLRNAGIDAPIHLFGGMLITAEVARYISDFDLMPTILRIEDATAVSQAATKSIRVFIKVEVGVERFGIAVEDVQAFAKIVRSMPNIELYGLSTHLHVPRRNASEVAPYLQRQFQRFEDAVRQVESDGELVPVKMAASSGSLSMTGTMNLNAVDPGHLLFGLRPGGPEVERLDIRPVMASLKSELVHIHVAQRTEDMDLAPFPVRRGMRIGVLPIGVVDGMLSLHSGSVLVNGCRCPVLDVSLEHTRIDLIGANALIGDEIVIIGRQGEDTIDITDVLAHHKLRIPASVPLAVHHTVPRVYIHDSR